MKIDLADRFSESQITALWKEWKRNNVYYSEHYLMEHSNNSKRLPFLRDMGTFYYKHKSKSKIGKYVIWASDFQINRLSLSDHFYVDG